MSTAKQVIDKWAQDYYFKHATFPDFKAWQQNVNGKDIPRQTSSDGYSGVCYGLSLYWVRMYAVGKLHLWDTLLALPEAQKAMGKLHAEIPKLEPAALSFQRNQLASRGLVNPVFTPDGRQQEVFTPEDANLEGMIDKLTDKLIDFAESTPTYYLLQSSKPSRVGHCLAIADEVDCEVGTLTFFDPNAGWVTITKSHYASLDSLLNHLFEEVDEYKGTNRLVLAPFRMKTP
ncbi:MAG: YopT-type cysteine protease domain-containing protein [Planctomycetota bacterium]